MNISKFIDALNILRDKILEKLIKITNNIISREIVTISYNAVDYSAKTLIVFKISTALSIKGNLFLHGKISASKFEIAPLQDQIMAIF